MLLVIDLDGFKQINDSYGHKAGDDALRHATRAMNSRIRSTDFIGRLGGDEFAILMPHLSAEDSTDVAASLVTAIRRTPLEFAGQEIHLSASVGATCVPLGEFDTLDEAILRADTDMYVSKAAARVPGRSVHAMLVLAEDERDRVRASRIRQSSAAAIDQWREAQHRLEMLDASIARQDAGTPSRLMRARPSLARQVEAAAERVRDIAVSRA
jgi:diguanylate cyclase (GGDEF)-like protein